MIKRLFISLSENGILWTIYYLLRRYLPICAKFIEKRMVRIENKKFIPGMNSLKQNKELWDNYDWQNSGEEWNHSDKWKNKLVRNIIFGNIKPNSFILEIGPGAGRWTDYIIGLSKKLILVDVSQKCLDICRKKYNGNNIIEYRLIDGVNLNFIENNSIEYIFSFDVFVHIDKREIEKYFSEFKRVLTNEGQIIFHYSKIGDKYGNFFSRFTEEDFLKLIDNYDFEVNKEFDVETLNVIENILFKESINQSISILMKKSS